MVRFIVNARLLAKTALFWVKSNVETNLTIFAYFSLMTLLQTRRSSVFIQSQIASCSGAEASAGVASLLWPEDKNPPSVLSLPSFTFNLPTLTKTFDTSTASAYSREWTPRSAPSSFNHLELRLLFVPDLISLPFLLCCPSKPSPKRHLRTSSSLPSSQDHLQS
jgi:hypothetical protein